MTCLGKSRKQYSTEILSCTFTLILAATLSNKIHEYYDFSFTVIKSRVREISAYITKIIMFVYRKCTLKNIWMA